MSIWIVLACIGVEESLSRRRANAQAQLDEQYTIFAAWCAETGRDPEDESAQADYWEVCHPNFA